MVKLPLNFYTQEDVVEISRQLLGKFLFTFFDGSLTGGMIIETEAYKAPEDKASHAYGMRRTKRNASMYEEGGVCYVYLCYGLHALFNVVTNRKEIPHAVLIRSIEPSVGIETMRARRGRQKIDRTLTNGPGSLTQALGINVSHNGLLLTGSQIWIEDRGIQVLDEMIIATPRIGIDYAGEDAQLLWRFNLEGF